MVPLVPDEPLAPELPLDPPELDPLELEPPLEPALASEPEPLEPGVFEPVGGSVANSDVVCGAKRSCVLDPPHAVASIARLNTLETRPTELARGFMEPEFHGPSQRCPTSSEHPGDSFVSPVARCGVIVTSSREERMCALVRARRAGCASRREQARA